MKNLIHKIAEALVDQPDKINISEIVGTQSIVLELKVAKEDTGKIIGKHGRTAHAIRTILNGASGKLKKQIILEILE
ncbi:MAG: KH domain-containing protein [Desulfobacteraceae bacterium]|nr:KH domain-containing protein [Desulfobacteraceae bacterium]